MANVRVAKRQSQQGFPLFHQFPAEIQNKIFTEAIRKPNIHFIQAKCRNTGGPGTSIPAKWHMDLYPVSKGKDTSGYRLLESLASVSKAAATAVHLTTAKLSTKRKADEMKGDDVDQVKWEVDTVPFKMLGNRFDAGEDLVCFEFPRRRGQVFEHFHPIFQLANTTPFDPDTQAEKLKPFKKVAFFWGLGPTCTMYNTIFHCAGTDHFCHETWAFCPEQLFGFINTFPSLREVYMILRRGNSVSEKEEFKIYEKNFYTLTSSYRRTHPLATFHATDRSYIELHPSIMHTYHAATDTYGPLPMPRARDLRTMLRQLAGEFRGDWGVADANDDANGPGPIINPPPPPLYYLLSVERRWAVTFKILVPTYGEGKGWGEEPAGRMFREMCAEEERKRVGGGEGEGGSGGGK